MHNLEPSPRKGSIRRHTGLTKELSLLVVQMYMGKTGLYEFFFSFEKHYQTVEHVLPKGVDYTSSRASRSVDRSGPLPPPKQKKKSAERRRGRNLEIERILTNGPCAKKEN